MAYGNLTKEYIIAAPKKLIPVPLISNDGMSTVASSCVESVLSYYHYELDRGVDWHNFLAATKEDGTCLMRMMAYLNKAKNEDTTKGCLLGIRLTRYMTICDLMADIDQGIPVICPIQAWYKDESGNYQEAHDYREEEGFAHYVVAIGYGRDCIYFMDPSKTDTYMYIPIDEFDARWHDTEGQDRFVRAGIQVKLNDIGRKATYVYKIM